MPPGPRRDCCLSERLGSNQNRDSDSDQLVPGGLAGRCDVLRKGTENGYVREEKRWPRVRQQMGSRYVDYGSKCSNGFEC